MIRYKITIVPTGQELIGKNLIREIQTFYGKDYITKDSIPYEVDKDSLMISCDYGKTWAKVDEEVREKIRIQNNEWF